MPNVRPTLSLLIALYLVLTAGCASEADSPKASSHSDNTPATETSSTQAPAPTTDQAPVPATADTVMIGGRQAIVWASSELKPQGGNDYGAANAFDGDRSTAWVEGVKGLGEGESLTVQFVDAAYLEGVRLTPGYAKSQTLFSSNSLPRTIEVQADWGSVSSIIPYRLETKYYEAPPDESKTPRTRTGCYHTRSTLSES